MGSKQVPDGRGSAGMSKEAASMASKEIASQNSKDNVGDGGIGDSQSVAASPSKDVGDVYH